MNYLGSHRNICKILGYSLSQQLIMMRYYPLGSLAMLIHQGIQGVPYTWPGLLNILHGISSAVQFMHTRYVAHCDLKPGNVLLEPMDQGSHLVRAVLTDFGISRILNAQSLAVYAFEVIHVKGLSVRYAAPEVIASFLGKQQALVDPRIVASGDVYSTGAIIYEIVTQKLPWSK